MSSLTNLNEKAEISSSARSGEKCVESSINRALLDPSKFGWTAGGEIADLFPPHQVCQFTASSLLEADHLSYPSFCLIVFRERGKITQGRLWADGGERDDGTGQVSLDRHLLILRVMCDR
jgi:hypothetical protein